MCVGLLLLAVLAKVEQTELKIVGISGWVAEYEDCNFGSEVCFEAW